MTQDSQIILKGLTCCSKRTPDCDDCPYLDHCRELEPDCASLIKSLLSEIEGKNCIIDRLGHDINIKLKYILELEEKVGISCE